MLLVKKALHMTNTISEYCILFNKNIDIYATYRALNKQFSAQPDKSKNITYLSIFI